MSPSIPEPMPLSPSRPCPVTWATRAAFPPRQFHINGNQCLSAHRSSRTSAEQHHPPTPRQLCLSPMMTHSIAPHSAPPVILRTAPPRDSALANFNSPNPQSTPANSLCNGAATPSSSNPPTSPDHGPSPQIKTIRKPFPYPE